MTLSHEVKDAVVRLSAAAQRHGRLRGGKPRLARAWRHLMNRPPRDVAVPQRGCVGIAFQTRDAGGKRCLGRSRKAIPA